MRCYTLDGLKLRKNGFFLLFLLYALIATLGMKFHERKEIFPVFSWSLFTYVWEYAWGYEIEITRVDDQVFDPPKNYYELAHIFPHAASRSPGPKKAASALGKANKDDPARLDELRAVIETRYLRGPERVDYNIVFVFFEPLERWHTGKVSGAIVDKMVTHSFSTGEPK